MMKTPVADEIMKGDSVPSCYSHASCEEGLLRVEGTISTEDHSLSSLPHNTYR